MLVGYSVKLLMVVILYIYMYRANKARDAAGHSDEKAAVEMGMHDQTELDNPGFRFVSSFAPSRWTVLTFTDTPCKLDIWVPCSVSAVAITDGNVERFRDLRPVCLM